MALTCFDSRRVAVRDLAGADKAAPLQEQPYFGSFPGGVPLGMIVNTSLCAT